jgi:phosphomannomutase
VNPNPRKREDEDGADAVKFGTDGWRGVIAREFTFDNVARVAWATADFLLSPDRKKLAIYQDWKSEYRPAASGVVVGYDMRFLSREFAHHFARIVQGKGIPVALSEAPVPTPALAYAVVHRRAAAGIMITASHNPPIYNGVKYKAEYGGSAPNEVTSGIEERLPDEVPSLTIPEGSLTRADLRGPFLDKVKTLIDPDRLKASPIQVIIDSMHGSASGYVAELLAELNISHREIRGTRDVLFGGVKPEPLEENLTPLKETILSGISREENLIGVVTDGDGDRIAAMDERGQYIDAHRTFALLLHYLVEERGWRGTVVKSFPLTDMAKAICREYHLPLIEVPVGFKYACEQILKRDVLIAAEESGSIAVRGHIPERDGVLLSLLLAEIAASAGKPMSNVVETLLADFGPQIYHRRDIVVEERLEIVSKLKQDPPERFAGHPVKGVETLDGVKLRFADGWLLFRASGTEPILRLYCEAKTEAAVNQLLGEAERLARGDLKLW